MQIMPPSVLLDAGEDGQELITILLALDHAARHLRGYTCGPLQPGLAALCDELRGQLLVAAAVARGQAPAPTGSY